MALVGEARAGARELKLGDSVAEGDEITSGRASHATLEFTDRSVVHIRPDSRLTIEAHRATTTQANLQTRLRLESGALEVRVAKQRAPNFAITSLWGNMAVRGTDFRARLANEAMLVEVLDGSMEVTGTAGRGGQVRVDAGHGTRVRWMEMPLLPAKLLGAPDISRVTELQQRPVVRLRFTPLAGAELYRIIAATDPDLREIVIENIQRPPDVRMISLRDGEYYYGVRAIDALGLEGAEARGRFRLKARPVPPAVQVPEPDAVRQPGSVTFSWAAAEEALRYRFQLATDEDFAAPLVNRDGLATRELEVEKLEAGRYFWRVASVRPDGDEGPFGDPMMLTLQAPAPQPAQ